MSAPHASDGDDAPEDAWPVLFISYSWTSPDHEQRVLALAEELRSTQRLDVRIDKWHLLTGDDAYAFMEQGIANADKVLIVSDCAYVVKADGRTGGAGTEAQVITPELYKDYPDTRADRPMGKYAVAVTERDPDGEMCVPRFYAGRIHVDLTDPGRHADAVEQIGRWAHDKPAHTPPPIGGDPAYLDDRPTTGTRAAADHARRALADGRPNALRAVEDYVARVTEGLAAYKPTAPNGAVATDDLVRRAHDLAPLYAEVESVLLDLARARLGPPAHRAVRGLFTGLFPYVLDHEPLPDRSRPGWNEERDLFRFFVPDVLRAAVAAFLEVDDVDGVAALTAAPYAPDVTNYSVDREGPLRFVHLQPGIQSSDHRDALADVRRQRDGVLSLTQLGQADMFLLLASGQISGVRAEDWRLRWWPYLLDSGPLYTRPNPLPAFQEAESRARLDRLAVAVSTDADGLLALIDEFVQAEDQGVRSVPSLSYGRLTNRRRLGQRP